MQRNAARVLHAMYLNMSDVADLLARAPESYVVADRATDLAPVVRRDGGLAILGGPVATFSYIPNAQRAADRLVSVAPTLDLTVMQIAEWAPARLAAIRAMCAIAEAQITFRRFTVGADAQEFTLQEMLDDNRDDASLCDWLRAAQAGDVRNELHAETVARVA